MRTLLLGQLISHHRVVIAFTHYYNVLDMYVYFIFVVFVRHHWASVISGDDDDDDDDPAAPAVCSENGPQRLSPDGDSNKFK